MVKWLIDVCELSPAIKDNVGKSPIYFAIGNGKYKIVEFLVEYDGSLISSLYERSGLYPLHMAVYRDKLKCAQVLLKHGADVLQPAEEGKTKVYKRYKGLTPLHLAIEGGSKQCIDELLNYEVDVNLLHPRLKISPLQIFLKSLEFSPMTDLHEQILIKDYKGLTPLHLAIEKESLDCFDELWNSVNPGLKISPLQIFRKNYEYGSNLHVQALVKMFIKGKKLNT